MAQGDLVSLAEVREHLQMPTAETEQDAVIQSLITRVSKAITRQYRREFVPPNPNPPAAPRRLKVPYELLSDRLGRARFYRCELGPYDLQSATSVRLHPETASPTTLVAGTDFVFEPVVKDPEGVFTWVRLSAWVPIFSTTAQRFGFAYLDIDGTWGFPAVPDDVKEACILAVVMHIRGEVQGFGSALQPNSLGSDVNAAEALPPGVRGLLAPYRRDILVR